MCYITTGRPTLFIYFWTYRQPDWFLLPEAKASSVPFSVQLKGECTFWFAQFSTPASRTHSLSLRSEEECPPLCLFFFSSFPPALYTPGRRNASFNILEGQSSAGRGEGSNETRQALASVEAAKNNYKTWQNRRLTVVIRGSQLLIYWPAFSFFFFFSNDLPFRLRSMPITEYDKASLQYSHLPTASVTLPDLMLLALCTLAKLLGVEALIYHTLWITI